MTDLAHPFASGGGGTLYEYKVATAAACDLLTSDLSQFGGVVSSIRFQTDVRVFDDFRIEGETIGGLTVAADVQVRHRQPLTTSDDKFGDLIRAAFEIRQDDSTSFATGQRCLVLAVSSTSPGAESLHSLCRLARTLPTSDTFEQEATRRGGTILKRLNHCVGASALSPSELHGGLAGLRVIRFDLSTEESPGVLKMVNALSSLWSPRDLKAGDALLRGVFTHLCDVGPEGATVDQESLRKALNAHLPRGLGAGTRRARLQRLRVAARMRVVARLAAVGLEETEAGTVANHALSTHSTVNRSEAVSAVIGEIGVGKSTELERLHIEDIDAALADPSMPTPVFLRASEVAARGLRTAVIDRAAGIGDLSGTGAAVLIDGLDEAGLTVADVSIDAHALVAEWPSSSFLLSTRPGEDSGSTHRISVSPLTEEQSKELLNVLGADPRRFAHARRELQDLIARPLFAISYVLNARREPSYGLATSNLIADLANVALGSARLEQPEALSLLTTVARASLNSGGEPVSLEQAGLNAAQLTQLLATRVAAMTDAGLEIQLAALTEWLGAQRLLSHPADIDRIAASPQLARRWRYAIAQAIALGDETQVDSLMNRLVTLCPAMAAWVRSEASRPHRMQTGEPLHDDPIAAGCRVRDATAGWTAPFGDRARLLTPYDGDEPATLGIAIHNNRVTTSWRHDNSHDVVNLPPNVHPLLPHEEWIGSHSGSPRGGAAWPWHWSFEEIQRGVARLTTARSFLAEVEVFHPELRWDYAMQILGKSANIQSAPVPVDLLRGRVEEMRSSHPDSVEVNVNGRWRLTEAEQFVADLAELQIREIGPPWPAADSRGGWVWDFWSTEQLLERLREATLAGLVGYEALVDARLPAMAKELHTYRLLPCQLVGYLVPGDPTAGLSGAPQFTWYLVPTPGEATSVQWTVMQEGEVPPELDWGHRQELLSALRPGLEELVPLTVHHGEPEIFSSTPAAQFALRCLHDDLRYYKWTSGAMGDLDRSHPPILPRVRRTFT